MPSLRRWYCYLLLCLPQLLAALPAANAASSSLQEIPPLTSPVIDMTGTLDANQRAMLSQKLMTLHDKYGAQMQVLIVATSAPEDAFTYSIRVVEKWKLGTAKVDNGLLLFIAKDDHRSQIQVGYGLEGTIPDVVASRMLDTVLAPYLRQGDFYGGINTVVDGIYQRIAGVIPPDQQNGPTRAGDENQPGISIFIMIAVGIVFMKIMRGVTGNIIAPVAGTPLLFCFVWLVIGWGLMMAAGIAFMALMLAWIPNEIWFLLLASSQQGRSGGGGFSSGGSSWSGGGGGFGGGGASGRW